MSKISSTQLAAHCGRVATSLESGIEERKVWHREAERARGALAIPLSNIASRLSGGESIAEAIKESASFFPQLFLQIVEMGEATGKLPTAFRRLAAHYEHRVRMRRAFLTGITWPAIQFFAAIFIVGFLIWILGAIAETKGPAGYDIVGLGLVGDTGLTIYVVFWILVFAFIAGFFFLLRSGALRSRAIELGLLRVPGVGGCVRTICLSRSSTANTRVNCWGFRWKICSKRRTSIRNGHKR